MTTNKFLLSAVLTSLILFSGCQKKAENLIQFVNPLIGTGLSSGQMLIIAGAYLNGFFYFKKKIVISDFK